MSSTYASHRPQFISMLQPDSMEKMLIPDKFVKSYISMGHMDNRVAILFGPLGKICHVQLKMNGPDTFFSDGWSQFLALQGITEANCLRLRHEGNLTFTVKVFGANGCQLKHKQNDIRTQQISTLPYLGRQQELPSGSIQKCKSKIDRLCSEGKRKPKASMTSLNNDAFWKRSFYDIGPPSWIKKVMNTNTLKYHLNLAKYFCSAIGLPEHCMITLKTSTDSTKSWHLHCAFYNTSSYRFMSGWKKFCEDNSLREGDVCTFNVRETTLWHVVITRCKEKIDQCCNQGTPPASSRKRKSENVHIASLNRAASKKMCIFEIGPPAWLKKEINTSTIENFFCLPRTFCEAIGLQEEPSTITLKTSMSSATSWKARVVPYKKCNHLLGLGWKRFCRENRIMEGDACTFNVVETKLWHVGITRHEEKVDQFKMYRLSTEGQKRSQVPMISQNKADRRQSVFDIGPPAWMKKEINASTIKSHLSLPLSFCEALGLRECCTVTLMTSTSSTSSWQARLVPYLKRGQLGSGWKRFCHENGIKVGDVCTFQIVEATLWRVIIARR